jgi:FkbM family methyltransferase
MKKENIQFPQNWTEYQQNQLYKEIFINNSYGKFFNINDNDIIIDMGSNIGLYSLYVFEKNSNINKIYMIEPLLQNFNYMIKNIIHNNPDNIHKFIFIKGAISEDGYSTIDSNNTSPTLNSGTELTKTFSFNSFINFYNINKIDILKIDVEGSELKIMDDFFFNYIIDKNINKICGEFHPMRIHGKIMSNLLKRFINIGYDILVTSVDGVIITEHILNNNILNNGLHAWDYYNQYLFYVKKT